MSRAVFTAMERLIELSLTADEKRQLAHKLNHATWNRRLDALLKRVDERQKGLPPVSMNDIVQEVKAVRRARASRRRA